MRGQTRKVMMKAGGMRREMPGVIARKKKSNALYIIFADFTIANGVMKPMLCIFLGILN